MLRRLALLALFSLVSSFGCTATDPALGQKNESCDEDLQCSKPLVCACVEIRGTGDDGNDEIVKHGTCQLPGFKCIKGDAGGDAVGFDTASSDAPKTDSGSDVEPDVSTDATTSDGTSDTTTSDTTTSGDATDAGG